MGRGEVVRRCLELLAGRADDPEMLVVLGGAHAQQLIAKGIPEAREYWTRVWSARGLLWAGAEEGTEELRAALSDDSWRVREMACKVVARHRIGDLLEDIASLEHDPVPRVRVAASRAVARIVETRA